MGMKEKPVNAIKNELGLSPAALLQELRKKFIADTENRSQHK